MKLFTQPS